MHLLVICLCLGIQLNAQVEPPIIRCITSDTIFYTPVSNSCGPFLSYEVFRSTNPNGPFSSITQIMDETADFYVDSNSSIQIQYYFVRPIFDCPGAQVINSDTVSNRPPELPILQTVSVVNGEIVLSWDISVSPEVVMNSVFLVTDTGLELIGETSDTQFTDSINNPNQLSFTYLIAATDDCDIQSIFGDPISSILLSNEADFCNNEISFEWNRHLNIEKQELWIIDNNGQSSMLSPIPLDAEEFTIEFLSNTDVQGFFIRAFTNEQDNEFADSNINLANGLFFLDEIFFSRMETIDENTIEIDWCWDENVNLVQYNILQNGPTGLDINTVDVTGSIPPQVNETISVNNTSEDAYIVQVSSTDVCDKLFDSEEISSIVLNVAPVAESTIDIEWSDYEYAGASLINYALHEVFDGVDRIIFEGNQNNYTQNGTADGLETCYYVEAIAEGVLLDGSTKSTVITSNTACTSGFPIIRLPNAFNPYGINSIFRPLFGNTEAIRSYEMSIFSRHGEQIFFTNVLEEGWNGRSGLRDMPQGVYSYLIKIDLTSGQPLTRLGSVLLVR